VEFFFFFFNFYHSSFSALPWPVMIIRSLSGRCGLRHEGPTGKRRCKRPLDVVFEAVTEESTPEAPVMAADDRLSTLVSVMSQLADRMDAQQVQLNQLQEVLNGLAPPPLAVPAAESGAIPKRPTPGSLGSCASDVNRASFPDLATLRDDPAAVAQATTMIDGLDLGPTGTALSSGSSAGVRSMRRGWAHPGGGKCPQDPCSLAAGLHNRSGQDTAAPI
jgi:hypothetical protein